MIDEAIAIIGVVWFIISVILLRLHYWKNYNISGKERVLSTFTIAKLIIKNSKSKDKKLTRLIWNVRISSLLFIISIIIINI